MQSRPIYDYIFFGTCLRYLQDVREGQSAHGQGRVVFNIKKLLNRLDEFDLHVTRRAALELEVFLSGMEDTEPSHSLSSSESKELRGIATDLRKTFEAESKGKVAFIVTDKRISVDKLLGRVRALFAPGVFDKLDDVAKYDLDESGKCIAIERSTAAAFHMLRATESELKRFYCSIVRRKTDRVSLMWGPMVDNLRKRRKPPSSALLDNLDNIRRNFRNPTQHPDKIYDIQEVQDLFGICVDAISRMVVSGTK